MKKNNLLLIVLLVLLVCTSCFNTGTKTSNSNEIITEDAEKQISSNDKNDAGSGEIDIVESYDDSDKELSPLDGLKYNKEDINKRPVIVSIDNHPDARQQAGLSQAEIIYECEVEGSYTRYLCVFLAREPKMVGPIRSARPYLIYYALEYDGIFVHVGGSQQAFNEIYNLNVADIDGLYSSSMYRYYDTGKVAPHNMYTTLNSIRKAAVKSGYKTEVKFEGYDFNIKSTKLSESYSDFKNNVKKAESINISYNKNNITDYSFDKNEKIYLRFKDGEKHLEELNGEQLTAKNIIVIETSKQVLDSEGRLYLGTVGKGHGLYITEGETVDISWEKTSKNQRTKFYLENSELKLNPGNTWIQVVSNLNCVTLE